MQDDNQQDDKEIDDPLTEPIIMCKRCNLPKTGSWYCYICAYPYNNDDCDD